MLFEIKFKFYIVNATVTIHRLSFLVRLTPAIYKLYNSGEITPRWNTTLALYCTTLARLLPGGIQLWRYTVQLWRDYSPVEYNSGALQLCRDYSLVEYNSGALQLWRDYSPVEYNSGAMQLWRDWLPCVKHSGEIDSPTVKKTLARMTPRWWSTLTRLTSPGGIQL